MRGPTSQVGGVSLRRVLPEAEFIGADDIRVTSCAAEAPACRPGDLFVALARQDDDLRRQVHEAAQRGAAALLTDRPAPGCRLPTCRVSDVPQAFGRLCQSLAGDPSRRLKVVGITGTNGKTTTSYLAASVLSAAGFQPGIVGTLGYADGVEVAKAPWTTPPAPVLATWLARMLANGCTHAVLEASSHGLAQSRLAGVDLDVGCVTNVRHDHLDYHGTLERYRAAKARLLDHLLPEAIAIVNADDEVAAGYLAHFDGPVLSVGIDVAAEVAATLVEQHISEQTFLLTVGSETVPVRTTLIGRHNVYNCLVAAAVGLAYGIDLAAVVRGLEAITTIPGRLERLECGQPFGVFVDYAHTADALAGCLATLRGVTSGRLICVFGAGGDRDPSKRPLMGRTVEGAADVAVITNDNPRSERPHEIVAGILSGFEHPSAARVILDRAEAIGWALAQARAGDCVLIAGKGHEREQLAGDERIGCDDRQLAREWLYSSSAVSELDRASA